MTRLLVLLVAVCGCPLSRDNPNDQRRCGTCPTGQSCIAGLCRPAERVTPDRTGGEWVATDARHDGQGDRRADRPSDRSPDLAALCSIDERISDSVLKASADPFELLLDSTGTLRVIHVNASKMLMESIRGAGSWIGATLGVGDLVGLAARMPISGSEEILLAYRTPATNDVTLQARTAGGNWSTLATLALSSVVRLSVAARDDLVLVASSGAAAVSVYELVPGPTLKLQYTSNGSKAGRLAVSSNHIGLTAINGTGWELARFVRANWPAITPATIRVDIAAMPTAPAVLGLQDNGTLQAAQIESSSASGPLRFESWAGGSSLSTGPQGPPTPDALSGSVALALDSKGLPWITYLRKTSATQTELNLLAAGSTAPAMLLGFAGGSATRLVLQPTAGRTIVHIAYDAEAPSGGAQELRYRRCEL